MKSLMIFFIFISSLSAFADCPAGDPYCSNKVSGAGTMCLGTRCEAYSHIENANTRLDGTSRNFRDNSSTNSSSEDGSVSSGR